jgi:hypothetical protein
MIDYRPPLDDILFCLEHGAEAARLPGWDADLVADVLRQAAVTVEREISPLDAPGDAEGARLEGGRARLPQAFLRAYGVWREGGWPGISIDESYGGMGLPHVLYGAVSEMLSGACVSYQMILSLGQGAMRAIVQHGSEEQKARLLPKLASGEWLATMCLTEPQAGSDLGLVRTLATPHDDGSWRISGAKIFTSGGDHDLTDTIVHLVLARTPGAPEGTKGLALFLCPAVLPDGRRNGVSVVRLEDKMGMHASPTCQMAFEAAEAEIVGAPGEGLARMFTMMNAERLDVAVQGVGLADVAGQRARAYAAERLQGRSNGEWPVALTRHADVQRMLLTQAALTLGCRAMTLRTAVDLELGTEPDLVAFMTPVCKAFATDAACQAADLGIQVHGGYGYLREYRAEQVFRDARITPIYEGTNGIQATTLTGRLLQANTGAAGCAFAADLARAAKRAEAGGCTDAAEAVRRLGEAWQRARGTIAGPDGRAVAFTRLSGLAALVAALARLEAGAAERQDRSPAADRARAAADFARGWLAPEAAALEEIVASGPNLPDLAPLMA